MNREAQEVAKKRRWELAKVLGYDPDNYLGPPIWHKLLDEVNLLVEDRKKLQTLRRILVSER